MFQFLKKIYDYIFPPDSNTQNAITLYNIMYFKRMQKHANKLNNTYKDEINLFAINYKKINNIDVLLQQISVLPYDIICISNINNNIHTYFDGSRYVVTYYAEFIANLLDMYYAYNANCIILSRFPISETKQYIVDELEDGNSILRITVKVSGNNINVYNILLSSVILTNAKLTNTFFYDVLDNNYNNQPYIITGHITHNFFDLFCYSVQSGRIMLGYNNIKVTDIIPIQYTHFNNDASVFYINAKWCNYDIYPIHQIKIGNYGQKSTIKVNIK